MTTHSIINTLCGNKPKVLRTYVPTYNSRAPVQMYVCTQKIEKNPIYMKRKKEYTRMKPQYAILRFAKYKGPEISRIEAHDERTKETYASNPDIDTSRSHLNYHLIEPRGHYRIEAEQQIFQAQCRTRTDSVRLVETLITGSPEFFKKKSPKEIREYFEHALEFLKRQLRPESIISAVVHMDEKTPHMHVSFVPLTKDNRLSAKDIIGNRKRLTQWQDDYWKHMVGKYPELERGQSTSETGRDHIPPRIFKDMTRLTKQRHRIETELESITMFNGKAKAQVILQMLDKFIPGVEAMATELKKYQSAFDEEESVRKENEALRIRLRARKDESLDDQMRISRLEHDYNEAMALIERIPPDILKQYRHPERRSREVQHPIER